jgi:peptide/nickel transport system ATP-binding protein/oligopeptide transport system ATP-binding protein
MEHLLEVDQLKTYYFTDRGVVKAVDGVSFSVEEGACIGIVGESGCGKSQTALSIMGLVSKPQGRIVGGKILYRAKNDLVTDLTTLAPNGDEYRSIRGKEIAMIFQEPMSSLSPVYTIGDQIVEAMTEHHILSKKEAAHRAVELLKTVGIPAPEERIHDYPHQLSGGMCQRAMIAMALSCEPRLLIADEPTTALDVTIQLQILRLLKELQKRLAMGLMMITHDLGVIAEIADYVIVMYLGKVVEKGPVRKILREPKHPYTQGLLQSRPSNTAGKARLNPIKGVVPSAIDPPAGCPFSTRCPKVFDKCKVLPPFALWEEGQEAACWLYENLMGAGGARNG